MRPSESLSTVAATVITAVFMVALVLMAPGLALADDANHIPARAAPFPDVRAQLDDFDEVATLDAVHIALSQVSDGGTYVWHRHNGRISAILQIRKSYKAADGQVCRALSVTFASGQHTRRTETTACRLANGAWQLEG